MRRRKYLWQWTIEKVNESIALEKLVRTRQGVRKIARATNSTLTSDVDIQGYGIFELGEAVRFLNKIRAVPVFSLRRISNILWQHRPVIMLKDGSLLGIENDTHSDYLLFDGKVFSSIKYLVDHLNEIEATQADA